MLPLFKGAKAIAANVPQPWEHGDYTAGLFQEDFPQFYGADQSSLVPNSMLKNFIDMANSSVLPSRWGSLWRYAAGLFVAHYSAMYLKTYAPESQNAAQAANSAAQTGVVKTASMGDTSVSYDNSAITAGTEKWGAWNATQYGAQLVTMARMIGMGGLWAG